MDNNKKTLKSPLSAKYVLYKADLEELKAKVTGETQKSLAREVLVYLKRAKFRIKFLLEDLSELEETMKELLK